MSKKIKRSNLFLFLCAITITLGISLALQQAFADFLFKSEDKGVKFGNDTTTLGNGENLLWGLVTTGSTGNFMLLQDSAFDNKFKIDGAGNVAAKGNITAGGQNVCLQDGTYCPTSIISAANISAGSFGVNAGGGSFNFPSGLTAAKFTVISSSAFDQFSLINSDYYPGGWARGADMQFIKNDSSRHRGLAYGILGGGNDLNGAYFSAVVDDANPWSTAQLFLNANGNVGIGTNAPAEKLDVNGTIRINGGDAVLHSGSTQDLIGTYSGWNANTVYIAGYNNVNLPASRTTTAVSVGGSGSERLWVNLTSGNVGIGTTAPAEKLVVNGNIFGNIMASNRNPVGLEYNILFNADNRYTVSQSGPASLNLASLFDGSLAPSYSGAAPTSSNPQIITIENLPNVHTQTGAWVGWTTRYWPMKKFKIEGYDIYAGYNNWRTLADYSSTSYGDSQFLVPVSPNGQYTKLKFTIYEASETDGRLGISELFFIHPEAGRPYSGLVPSSIWEGSGGNVGIGVTNPSSILNIKPPTDTEGLRIISSNYSPFIIRNSANNADIFRVDQSGNLTITGNVSGLNIGGWTKSGNNLYATDVNDKVGIGTTAPAGKLHITGATFISPASYTPANIPAIHTDLSDTALFVPTASGGNLDLRLYIDDDATDRFSIWGNSCGGGGCQNLANSSEVAQFRADGGIYLKGNVGIGTPTPNSKLEVYTATTGGKLRLSSDNANTYGEIRFSSNNGSYLNYGSSIEGTGDSTGIDVGDLRFKTGYGAVPTERMRITSTGNVGIGTTAPGAQLTLADVYSAGGRNLLIGDDTFLTDIDVANTLGIYGNQDNTIASLKFGSGGGTISGYNNNIGIGTATPAEKLDVNGTIRINGGDAVLHSGSTQDLIGTYSGWNANAIYIAGYNNVNLPALRTTTAVSVGGSGSERLWVNLTSGNVGIGTTAPAEKLVVNGNAIIGSSGAGYAYLGNRGYYIGEDLAGSDIQTNAPNMYVYDGAWKRLLREGDTITASNADTVDNLHSYNFAEQMDYLADISTRIPKSGFYQTDAPTNGWYPGASSWQHIINSQHSNTGNNYALQIVGGFWDQNLYFRKTASSGATLWNKIIAKDSSNNISLWSPYTGGDEGNITAINQLTGYNDLFIKGNSGENAPIYYGASEHRFYTNTTEKFTILNNGNIGIGTATPAEKLDVNGTIRINGGDAVLHSGSTQDLIGTYSGWNANAIYIAGYNNVNLPALRTTTAVSVGGSGSERLWVNLTSGNVGIGTTAPAEKLVVNGNAIIGSSGAGYAYLGNRGYYIGEDLAGSDIQTNAPNMYVYDGAWKRLLREGDTITASGASSLTHTDNRIIAPNEYIHNAMHFGFTSYNNNNTSPWADFMLLNSYGDSSGGNDNLLTVNRSTGFGMRLYQQSWNSGTAFSSYKDVVLADNGAQTNYLTKYTNVGNVLSVGNSTIYDNGNVGIKTSTPGYPLHIADDDSTGVLNIENDGGSLWTGLRLERGGNEKWFVGMSNADEKLRLRRTGTSDDLVIDTNGNVGIGTTVPVGKLEVAGGGGTSKIYKEISTGQPDYSYYYLKLFKLPTGSGWAATTFNGKICATRSNDISVTQCADIYVSRDYSSNIYFSENMGSVGGYGSQFQPVTINDGGFNWVSLLYDAHGGAGIVSWTVDGTLYNGNPADVISLSQINSTSSIHSALSYVSRNTSIPYGNVGIGTAAPAEKLDVNGTIRINGGDAVLHSGSTQDLIGTYSGWNANTVYIAGYNNVNLPASRTTTAVSVGGSGSERLWVNLTSGNVGIGTVSPSAKLQVNPPTDVEGLRIISSNYSPFIIRNSADTADIFRVDQSGNLTITGNVAGLNIGGWTKGSGTIYATDVNDKVGIGTNAPAAKLTLSNNVASGALDTYAEYQQILYDTGSPATSYGLGIRGGTMVFNSDSAYQFDEDGSTNVTIASAGKVGIGTAAPNKLLHVYKDSGDNAEIDLQSVAGANNHWGIYSDRTTNDLRLWRGSDLVTFANNGNMKLAGATLAQGGKYITQMPWFNAAGAPAGYIKLVTPIVDNESNMFSIKITGYMYSTGGTPLEIRCGGYAYSGNPTGSALINTDCHTEGSNVPVMIAEENRGGQWVAVIRIGTPASTWYYNHFTAEYIGWQVKKAEDFQWVTGETTPANGENSNLVYTDDSAGSLSWASNNSGLVNDQGGSIELGGNNGVAGVGVPYIDFHYNGKTEDYNVRLINNGDRTLNLSSGSLAVDNGIGLGSDLTFVNNKSIRVDSGSVNTALLLGNYGDGAGFGYGTGKTASLAVEGDVKGDRLCIEESCLSSWGEIGAQSGWTDDGAAVRLTTATDNVGIGTAAPVNKLTVYGASGDYNSVGVIDIGGTSGTGDTLIRMGWNSGNYSWIQGYGAKPLYINPAGNNVILNATAGNVGIGTTVPSEKLEIAGNTKITGNLTVGGTFSAAYGADLAEEFTTKEEIEKGTVLIMGDDGYKSAKPCDSEYDIKVIGVVSDNAAVIMGHVESDHKAVVTISGVVSVKVSAKNGIIKKGDLLTASNISGYAMKAIDAKIGTVIGKALEECGTEKCKIKALINLQ